jgi:mannose-6-phosphate isomerase-like protein (cupin superfamily)
MKVTSLNDAFIVMQDDRMTGRRLYASDGATIIHMIIHPGQAIAPHAADVDMEFYVISGSGRFSVGDESADAGSGMLVVSPAEIPHGITNTGSAPLELIAVKNGKGRSA